MVKSPAAPSASGAPGLLLWLGLAVLVVVIDQLSKTLILGWFQYGEGRAITSFFNLVRAHNTGAAFSFLAHAGGWQRWFFTALALAASAFIVWMLKKHPGQKLFCFAITMIMGGALGNVIDRLMHGYVVDMLDFHLAGRHFPAFNLADSAITLGAICLIVDELRRVRGAK
ncbi:signal peptidase II [Azohydromonas lata]|uniref:Lipoprotein signal peptidase n=1 Tax=Azohydromonas lata TaxID=45677 RepID=A0ABU5IDF1_9BURK|nr:signal peptidase II [Azohydromonas lata]MDZ5457152.1 signal peptidase II [Azohydromonas lata]